MLKSGCGFSNLTAVITIDLKGQSYNVTEDQIIKTISHAIDEVLGKDCSILVFKTAKLVYKTDYSHSLPYLPDSFQEFLRKTFGEKKSTAIMDTVISHMPEFCISVNKQS